MLDHKGPIFFRGGATHYSDGEGSLTIHMVRDFSLDHKGPIFFRGGATHYSDGEGSLTIHMVRDFSLDC